MSFSMIGRLRKHIPAGDRRAPGRCGPRLEALEDRTLPSVSLVKDINTAPQSSSPNSFTDANGVMFFHAYDPVHGQELWKTDGTAAGTTLVTDIYPGWQGSVAPVDQGMNMVALGGDVYFTAVDPTNGRQIWKSDGTAAGTVPILGMPTSFYGSLTSIDGGLYFQGLDSSNQIEIYESDGSAAGTVQLTFGGVSNQLPEFSNLNGTVYFLDNQINGP